MRSSGFDRITRLGIITLVVGALLAAAAFNLSKFPGLRSPSYRVELVDAGGLARGNSVQIAGIQVGRVDSLSLEDGKVIATFEVEHDVELGDKTSARVAVENVLGQRYLELVPTGKGTMKEGDLIPVARSSSSYNLVDVLGRLTTTTEDIDTGRLRKALVTVADTVDAAAPELGNTISGLSRLSRTISSRDAELQALLSSAQSVTEVLSARSDDLVSFMSNSSLVFDEIKKRRVAIHDLLVNARRLSVNLQGLVDDNQAQIGPALRQVESLLTYLNGKDKELRATLKAYGPFTSVLGNIVGTGPWFDAFVINLLSVPTGEFVPSVGPPR